jgi:hypothetical protein
LGYGGLGPTPNPPSPIPNPQSPIPIVELKIIKIKLIIKLKLINKNYLLK